MRRWLMVVLWVLGLSGVLWADIAKMQEEVNWRDFQSIAIQHGGRIKPLDTFARILLYQFSGRSSLKTSVGKISPIQWLFLTLFDPEVVEGYSLFLVENPEVLEALDLDYKRSRDRYTYRYFKPKMGVLRRLAVEAQRVESKKRTLVQKQILNLYHNLLTFEGLIHALDFARPLQAHFDVIAKRFGKDLTLLDYQRLLKRQFGVFERFQRNFITTLGVGEREALQRGQIPAKLRSSLKKAKSDLSKESYVVHLERSVLKNFYASLLYDPSKKRGYLILGMLGQKEEKLYVYGYPFRRPERLDPRWELGEFLRDYSVLVLLEQEFRLQFKRVAGRMEGVMYRSIFAIFPPLDKSKELWLYPWAVFESKLAHGDFKVYGGLLERFANLQKAYNQEDWAGINRELRELKASLVELVEARGEYKKIPLELRYFRHQPFFWALLGYIVASLLCALSWLGIKRRFFYRISLVALAGAFAIHTYGIGLRIMIKGRPPVSTLYESVLFVGWVCVASSFVVEGIFRRRFPTIGLGGGALVGSILMFVARRFANDGDNLGVLVAVLDSNFWLATHVTTISIGYSACLLAGAIGHIFILMQLFLSPQKRYVANREVYRMLYGTICFATVFSFLGTVLGGLWADQSWGRFWGWDPKENGALLIVLWNACLLHMRLGGYVRDWGMAMGAIFGNIVVAAAWWGVNLLQVGLHSYGFTSGLGLKLMIFAGIELGFIGVGGILYWRLPKPQKPSPLSVREGE